MTNPASLVQHSRVWKSQLIRDALHPKILKSAPDVITAVDPRIFAPKQGRKVWVLHTCMKSPRCPCSRVKKVCYWFQFSTNSRASAMYYWAATIGVDYISCSRSYYLLASSPSRDPGDLEGHAFLLHGVYRRHQDRGQHVPCRSLCAEMTYGACPHNAPLPWASSLLVLPVSACQHSLGDICSSLTPHPRCSSPARATVRILYDVHLAHSLARLFPAVRVRNPNLA
ncbi:hypothetical protein BOTBODRAFT_560409 [Botryobasidium botryosum FD-172 SS1]|uniref:Uncharacterized protein n=1 Tax=Botryobasidium botryosum (strain FD-172 SS1) TaxID=930990 RepID=A0A067LZJ8_BOTB1|nr:hypothetical protein BOTBODRAFT_560409 [Botryobasidium botryosum FD-172 SS1]